jgi:hypothetical protein
MNHNQAKQFEYPFKERLPGTWVAPVMHATKVHRQRNTLYMKRRRSVSFSYMPMWKFPGSQQTTQRSKRQERNIESETSTSPRRAIEGAKPACGCHRVLLNLVCFKGWFKVLDIVQHKWWPAYTCIIANRAAGHVAAAHTLFNTCLIPTPFKTCCTM